MIALEFPPVNSTGCYRYLKFIKYLHEFKVNVTILAPTVSDLTSLHPNAKIDNNLMVGIPESVKIVRIPLKIRKGYTHVNFSILSKILHYINFKGETIARKWESGIKDYLSENIENFDAAFISIPPFSLGRSALSSLKRFSIPLIIDFRDEWSLNKSIPFPTYFHYLYAYSSEHFLFKESSAITSVTNELICLFRKIHQSISPNKISLISNGFDNDVKHFSKFTNVSYFNKKKYLIGYSGSYYYDPISTAYSKQKFYERPGIKKITYKQDFTSEDWTYRSPFFFLKAVKLLLDRRIDLRNVVEFHHVGHCPKWLINMIRELGLENNFISHGYVSKSQNLSIQENFNALLCTSEKVINEDHYCLSSKVFDYVQMKKPILAFVTNGSVKSFIEKSGCGIIFDPDNEQQSSDLLEHIIESDIEFHPNIPYLEQFHPRFLTMKLRQVIDNVLISDQL